MNACVYLVVRRRFRRDVYGTGSGEGVWSSLVTAESGVLRITLSNPAALARLLAFLSFDPTAVVTPIGEREIEVSFLGSLNEAAQRRELELRLRAWLDANPDLVAVVSDKGSVPNSEG